MSMSQGLSAISVQDSLYRKKTGGPAVLEISVPGIYTNYFCNDGLWPNRGIPGGIVPTRIRYTSMSLPYHIGNGVWGT